MADSIQETLFENLDVGGQLEEMASTIFLEAENQPYKGKLAVSWCIVNRVRDARWSDNPASVCHQKWQFSAWNEGMEEWRDKRFEGHAQDPNWVDSWKAACSAYFAFEADPTKGACHYLVSSVQDQTYWAKGKLPCVIIGDHSFFNDIA